MSTAMRPKDYEKAIKGYLAEIGIKEVGVEQRANKHYRISWLNGREEVGVTYAATPSDHRSFQNAMAEVKRLTRAYGSLSVYGAGKLVLLTVDKTHARRYGFRPEDRFDYGGDIGGIHIRKNPEGGSMVRLNGRRLHFRMSCGKIAGVTTESVRACSIPLDAKGGSLHLGRLPEAFAHKPVKPLQMPLPEPEPETEPEPEAPPPDLSHLLRDLHEAARMLREVERQIADQNPGFYCTYKNGLLKTQLVIEE